MKKFNNKKYILFDNDGVLVETEKWYYEASIRALNEIDSHLDFDEYMEIMSSGSGVWVKALANGVPEKVIIEARNKRNLYYQEYLRTKDLMIPNVKNILNELSKKYKMGIVTTSRRVDFEIIHNGQGITDFMDFILCEEDYEFAKPHPQPYLKGLDIFKGNKENAIIIEDSQRGLQSAVAANIDCLIVHNEFTKTQDFSSASHKIDTLEELLSLL